MRYESKPQTSKGIAIFTATFGTILLYYAGFIASGAAAVILTLFGLTLLILTVIAATASYSVTVDRESGKIVKEFNSRMVNRKWEYRIDQFDSVRVGVGGRGAFGAGIVVYSAQLTGSSTLSITSWCDDRSKVELEAKTIAEYLNIPFRPGRK